MKTRTRICPTADLGSYGRALKEGGIVDRSQECASQLQVCVPMMLACPPAGASTGCPVCALLKNLEGRGCHVCEALKDV